MKKAIILLICVLAVIYATIAVLLIDFDGLGFGRAQRADGWIIVRYLLTDNEGNHITDTDGNNVFHNKNVPLFINHETGIKETRHNHTRFANADLFTYPGHAFDAWWMSDTRYEARSWIPGGLTCDFEVHSTWMPQIYQVTFDPVGGSPTPTRAWVRHGDQFGQVISANSHITRPHFDFGGWWTAPHGGTQVWHDTIVEITENTTLFARWIPQGSGSCGIGNTFAINYYGNGHTSTNWPMGFQEFAAGSNATLRPNGFVRAGFRFDGWATSPHGGVVFPDLATITNIQRSYHLWAVWSPCHPLQQVTVSLIPTAGGRVIDTMRVEVGQNYGSLPTISLEGWKFIGWFTDCGAQVTSTTQVTVNRNHNLTARWAGQQITLTYTCNIFPGGPHLGSRLVTVGQVYGTMSTISIPGRTFNGWWTDCGRRITATSIVETPRNHRVTARWL